MKIELRRKTDIGTVKRFINSAIEENLPKKYKRSAFISALITALCGSASVSRETLDRIEKFFTTGIISNSELMYGQMLRGYIWKCIASSGKVELEGKNLPLKEAIELYTRTDTGIVNEISYMMGLIDAIYKAIPSYIKYGSEKLLKHDIYNTLMYIRSYR